MDLLLAFGALGADMKLTGNDLARDEGLLTAVVVSLFTDRLADSADELPAGETDRKGWWGDSTLPKRNERLGSKLWLIRREKQLAKVAARAEEYAREALQWLVEDRLARSVSVSARIAGPGLLGIAVRIVAAEGSHDFNFRYDWTAGVLAA